MTTINIRIEEKTKKAATKALADMGMDLSTGVKLFLHQVVKDQGMPFTPSNNPTLIRATWDAEVTEAVKNGKRYTSAHDALRGL